jgi:hydroxymethylpyrimidine pyrophosphatase-like HAD family hydrolase
MKIIFLDIDGVMNTDTHLVRSEVHEGLEFCPIAIRVLQEVIKETGAKVVISSTWRAGRSVDELQDIFRNYSEDIALSIIGKTSYNQGKVKRGVEIREFVDYVNNKENEFVTNFVVLDDDNFDMDLVKDNLIRCYSDQELRGLTEDLKPRILKLLE